MAMLRQLLLSSWIKTVVLYRVMYTAVVIVRQPRTKCDT